MKKTILLFSLFLMAITLSAQEISNNAIGIRLGGNNGFGGEISYQKSLNESTRLEIDLGIRGDKNYSAFKLAGLYQWVYALPEISENVNWYFGAGGGIGSWNIKDKVVDSKTIKGDNSSFLFGAGVVGIEYHFNIPLMVSLDFRPELGFSDVYKGFNSDFGLSFRYKF